MACGFSACLRRAVCAAASVCAPLSQVSCRYQDRVVKTADFLLRLQCKNGAIRDFAGADTVNAVKAAREFGLIGANSKRTARIEGMRAICEALSDHVDLSEPLLDPELRIIAERALGVTLKPH